MQKRILILLLGCFCYCSTSAQEITQTIRGTVVDQESKFPLIGVNIKLLTNDGSTVGTTTDVDGTYRLDNVPVGRQGVELTYLGYERVELTNIIVSSGKEVILNVEMAESATDLVEVEVIAQKDGDARNEMATVSARKFSVEETERYAGSRGDPGRMASNFAGVQGADDSRNDIVIRGNSPQGVLWRFEGVNIPNPNHFAIPGTGGGSVTILNNKYLSNSDFFTGAFPAEYGNSIAGVFDLRMRNGNNEKHEFSGQLGILGTEILAEGPLNKEKRSSYIVSYRYSTLKLFTFLGINFGTDAVPQYQDAAFRVNFPRKNGGNIALWGIGGTSTIDILVSDEIEPDPDPDLYASNDRDQYFGSTMGTIGLTYTQPFSTNTFLKATLSASHQNVTANHDYVSRRLVNGKFVVDSLPPILDYSFTENKYAFNAFLNHKTSRKGTLKAGINIDLYDPYYIDSVRAVRPGDPLEISDWRVRWDGGKLAALVNPFVQYKHKFNDKLTAVAGLSSMYYSINENSFSPIEPRVGLTYNVGKGQRLNFGYGLHSQVLPGYLYYYGKETIGRDPQEQNLGLGLTKSHHFVLGYDWVPSKTFRIKAETYYQSLFDIPVRTVPSSFSLVNSGSGFSRFFPEALVNEGTGRNYGVELTLERFFSGGYYFLITSSLFDSKYKGSDGVERNTSFNGRYAFNGLVAKEFTFNNRTSLNIGGKITYAGGRWYGPVDEAASILDQGIIYEDETVNTLQFAPYLRADLKIAFLWNRPKFSHELAIDFVNVTNRQNILTLTYAPDNPSGEVIIEQYQLGFLPLFYYKIEF